MPSEITDPELLKQLNGQEVTDPAILKQLQGGNESIPRTVPQSFNPLDIYRQAQQNMRQTLGGAYPGIVKPALQIGGGILGAGLGGIPGAGLGYAGGGQLGDVYEAALGIDKDAPSTLGESAKRQAGRMAIDVPMGAFGEFANVKWLQPALNKIISGIKPMAEKLAMGVLKPKTGVTSPLRERLAGTRKVLSEGMPLGKKVVSEETLAASKAERARIDSELDTIMQGLDAQGKQVRMGNVLDEVHKLKKSYSGWRNKDEIYQQIDDAAKGILSSRGWKLKPSTAQEMKKGSYAKATQADSTAFIDTKTSVDTAIDKALGRGLKQELEGLVEGTMPVNPIRALNKESSEWKSLEKVIETALKREQNKYGIGLMELGGASAGAALGGSHGGLKEGSAGAIGGAMLARALRSPEVMLRLAHLMYKAGQKHIGTGATRAAAFTMSEALEPEAISVGSGHLKNRLATEGAQ